MKKSLEAILDDATNDSESRTRPEFDPSWWWVTFEEGGLLVKTAVLDDRIRRLERSRSIESWSATVLIQKCNVASNAALSVEFGDKNVIHLPHDVFEQVELLFGLKEEEIAACELEVVDLFMSNRDKAEAYTCV